MNIQYFQEYCAQHRPHQRYAFDALQQYKKGQGFSPCGTGKTRIQISVHVQDMIDKSLQNTTGVYLIASHRLVLNRQLLRELVSVVQKCDIPFSILNISSDQQFGKNYSGSAKYLRTTDKAQATQFAEQCKKNNRHLIVIATYDSVDKLSNFPCIDVATFDEAHNTTEIIYRNNINEIKHILKREYYFTATRKVEKNTQGGMDDEDFYGEVIFDFSPKDALDSGEIVCPRLHPIKSAYDLKTQQNNFKMIVKNTIEGFLEHKKLVKEHSLNPNLLGAKLLITTSSVDEMLNLYFNLQIFCNDNNIQAFAISSDNCLVNFNNVNKTYFIDNLNKLKDEQDAIIVHYDILTEGIDLPSITGVMTHRHLKEIKLMQLIGRALRLHKEDRKKLYSGAIKPGNALKDEGYEHYTKPYGWCIIPEHMQSIGDHEKMKEILQQVFSFYGTPLQEYKFKKPVKSKKIYSADEKEEIPQQEFDLVHFTEPLVSEEIMVKGKPFRGKRAKRILNEFYTGLKS